MLSLIVPLVVQRPAYAVFETFVEQSTKAVLGVAQGSWKMTSTSMSNKLILTILRGGEWSTARYELDGKPAMEVAIAPTSTLYVDHRRQTFSRATYPQAHGKKDPEPLRPLGEDQFDVQLPFDRGFVLRTNPPATKASIKVEGDVETLFASIRKKSGKTSTLELSRDAKTKLPISLRAQSEGEPVLTMEFAFVRREVLPIELAIDSESYKNYREQPFASAVSR